MSRLALRILVVFVLAALAFLRWPIASVHAGGGDISSDTDQSGSSDSGDAVGGQVVGVSSSGSASVDATNRSEDVDVSTGDSEGSNRHDGTASANRTDSLSLVLEAANQIFFFEDPLPEDTTREELLDALRNEVGVDTDEELLVIAAQLPPEDFEIFEAFVLDEFVGGDVESSTTQSGDVGSGDAVAGQAIGVVTQRRGQADVVVSNVSEEVSLESGDTDLTNSSTVEATSVAAPK